MLFVPPLARFAFCRPASRVMPPEPLPCAPPPGGGGLPAAHVSDDGHLGCWPGYTLVCIGLNNPNQYDVNQNAHICKYIGNQKPLHMDDSGNGVCKRNYTPI